MMRTFSSLVAGCVLFLAGCSGGSETSDSQASQLSTYVETLRAARAARPVSLPTLTPALINSLTVPSLEVSNENTGLKAFLVPFSDRRDGGPGSLRTWRTIDNAQLTLRDGVLVTSRGFGNDLGSAQANAAVRAIRARSPISGPHTLYVKTGSNSVSKIDLLCEMRTVGTETIEIVQSRHNVVHLQENCTGARGIITYDYWVDRNDSTVWQTRQWMGPENGYIRTRLLKK